MNDIYYMRLDEFDRKIRTMYKLTYDKDCYRFAVCQHVWNEHKSNKLFFNRTYTINDYSEESYNFRCIDCFNVNIRKYYAEEELMGLGLPPYIKPITWEAESASTA